MAEEDGESSAGVHVRGRIVARTSDAPSRARRFALALRCSATLDCARPRRVTAIHMRRARGARAGCERASDAATGLEDGARQRLN